jgi:hypothetical protein
VVTQHRADGEIGFGRLRPLDEQPHRVVLHQAIERWELRAVGQGQWRHPKLVLAIQMQHLAEDEYTVAENCAAFRRIKLRPRVLVDVATRDLSIEVLGQRISLPVLLGPTALQRLAHADAELACVRAVAAAGTIGVFSTETYYSIREIAAATEAPLWFQLYCYVSRAVSVPFEADRHAKKELKKRVRGIRPLERAVEGLDDEAHVVRGYALAVRSAVSDDGQAPLGAPGLRLHERLNQVAESLQRVEEKGPECATEPAETDG